MKKILMAAALPLVLGSCGLFGTPTSYDVSGTMSGTQPSGTIKLALIGISTAGILNADVPQAKLTLNTTKFSVDLPDNVATGAYSIVGYVDSNDDSSYGITETRTKIDLSKSLTFDSSTKTWKQGSVVIRQNGKSINRISNYDLSW